LPHYLVKCLKRRRAHELTAANKLSLDPCKTTAAAFFRQNKILSGSWTKRFSLFPRQITPRTTASTRRWIHQSVALHQKVCYTRTRDVQHKRNGICCGVETRVYGIVFLCNLEWKWTATIIVKYCWRRSCCYASMKYRMTISYSNRTAQLCTRRMTQSGHGGPLLESANLTKWRIVLTVKTWN